MHSESSFLAGGYGELVSFIDNLDNLDTTNHDVSSHVHDPTKPESFAAQCQVHEDVSVQHATLLAAKLCGYLPVGDACLCLHRQRH